MEQGDEERFEKAAGFPVQASHIDGAGPPSKTHGRPGEHDESNRWAERPDAVAGHFSYVLIARAAGPVPARAVRVRDWLTADPLDYMSGTLWVDEFVTHNQQLEDINKGFDDMHAGDCIRCVVNMGQGTDKDL